MNHTIYKSMFMESFLKDLWKSIHNLSSILKKYKINFVIIGGSALNQYNYNRMTEDIDILIAKKDKDKVKNIPIGFIRDLSNGKGKRLRLHDPLTPIDVIYEGEVSGDGIKGLKFKIEDINMIQGEPFISLKSLIEYKISSGIYGKGRLKDLADVQELIKRNNLDLTFGNDFRIDLKNKYLELWSSVS